MSALAPCTTRALLKDSDLQVRLAMLGMIEPMDRVNRVLSVSPALADPVRGVRIEAARLLADVPDSQLPAGQLAARAADGKALEESLALVEADWPSGKLNLGNLHLRQGRAALVWLLQAYLSQGFSKAAWIHPPTTADDPAQAEQVSEYGTMSHRSQRWTNAYFAGLVFSR